MKDYLKPIIFFGVLCGIVLFFIFTVFVWKPFVFSTGVNLSEEHWLEFWGNFLGFMGTSSLGILAVWQNERIKKENDKANEKLESANLRAYELNKELLKIQKQNKLSVIGIDTDKGLKVYTKDNGLKFINKLNEKNTLRCEVNFVPKSPEQNDFVLFEFYIKNISNNYIKHIELEGFELKPELKDKKYRTSRCNGDADKLIAPFETCKLLFIVANFNTKLKDVSVKDYLENMFDFTINVSIRNLYGDITKIMFDLYAEGGFEEDEDVLTYTLSNISVEIDSEF